MDNARTPLVIFNKQLGDVLLLEPALAKLSDSCGSPVALSTRPAFAPMLSLMDNVLPAKHGLGNSAITVISFDPKFKAWLRTFCTKAATKHLVVTRPKHLRWWHKLAYHNGCLAINEEALYRAQYFFEVMPGASTMAFRPPRLTPPPVEWQPADLPENYVLLHPTSAWKSKSWPAESWAAVLRELHEQGIGPFVITGGNTAWEMEYVDALVAQAGLPVINLCGKTPLTAYLSVISRARLVLCVDGSATHLAAAFKRPAVTLFGPTHPKHWHYPSPNSALLDAHNYASERKPAVANIPTPEVIKAASSMWKDE